MDQAERYLLVCVTLPKEHPMDITALPEPTTVTMTPSQLAQMDGDGDGLCILNVVGIATDHRLTLEHGSTPPRLIYAVFPLGGEYNSLRGWARTPREFKCWELPAYSRETRAQSMQLQAAVCQYVLDAACDEVAAESDLGEGWRTA